MQTLAVSSLVLDKKNNFEGLVEWSADQFRKIIQGVPKKRNLVKIKTGNIVLNTTGKPNELHKICLYLKKAEGLSFLQIVVYFL